ncbi:MAG TPA: alpha-L-arabinofuranosidase [Porphyromonadaceae bacterium]|nr:alpha-L-arabinofuranosidase [Porphyromonadaceae bacterium]HCC18398.1 alpha-L-arabinofuranosidase [Porphyromonadaceae bacterium]
MRKFLLPVIMSALLLFLPTASLLYANEPDSAFLFAYGEDNGSGLYFAWSTDQDSWHAIGHRHTFLKSDYGRWGSQKRMHNPFLTQAPDGQWHAVWSLNNEDGAIAHTVSNDLVYWKPQSYPVLMSQGNCLFPEISHDKQNRGFEIRWQRDKPAKGTFQSFTSDFKHFTPAVMQELPESSRREVMVAGNRQTGTIHRVPWQVIDRLISAQRLAAYKQLLNSERVALSPDRFKEPLAVSIKPDAEAKKPISSLLMGIFYEDINYAADGGLYAELIQNRGFEYDPADKEGRDKNWNSRTAWSLRHADAFQIDTLSPIHPHNRHYAVLHIDKEDVALVNEGFNGIPLKAGERYDLSLFARSPEKKRGPIRVRLTGKNGEIYGETITRTIGNEWKKQETVITATHTADDARIELTPQQTGRVDLDMISLFPQKTFKGRKNGMRADLAQVLADLKPRFMRFPGGCVAHGDGIGNIYRWENTIGPLEARKPQRNLWGYQQSFGLGYYEYFQFCEDIGAEPVPVVAAGVPCQNSAHHGCVIGGQQGGIPMEEMDAYIQTVLNLIEYANGDAKSEWGKKRAEAGHPKPFNLKYIGVGNEDLISDIFAERFVMIHNAIREKYPEITVIGTAGPFSEGSDYVEGWNLATEMGLTLVDEHYYQPPGWYLNNQDYYDRYDRSKAKVYLGEYAAHVPGRHNNLETALCEALHLINVERNADIVAMTSYAPLLAKEGFTQWNPDLIYFNNTEVKPTVGYYVQKLFGHHAGSEYIASRIIPSDNREDVRKRIAASFVTDKETNDLIIKLVNLLPVTVSSNIDLTDMQIPGNAPAMLTVMQGNLDDETVRPEESALAVSGQLDYDLPAYSFSIIRIKRENKLHN